MVDIRQLFDSAMEATREEYRARRSQLTYTEYLAEVARRPRVLVRDAAQYMLDAIDHFGKDVIERPWGRVERWRIFDQEFGDASQRLVGQEEAQGRVRDAVASQVRDGKVNRLIVIHGPNGSAKSTLVACLFRGLDHYSRLPEGELHRFRWIFPSRAASQGSIGFGGSKGGRTESFAHLPDEHVDSTLECEMRDHPLLLLPKAERLKIIEAALAASGEKDHAISEHFLHASLCHRCRQVADALMRTHQGDLGAVLAHVQVEPWAISRRYRRGLVQVGPQMSLDAGQRQITADRSLGALPIELQNMTLFETYGPLVDGSGGVIEFEDMLKRPLDGFKYLLGTIETGEAMLSQSILKLNSVLMATTNDVMLEAFREHHEYPSFRDRMTLVPVPYIRHRGTEAEIYQIQLVPRVGRHVAPHAVEAAAHWAVLARLHKPDPELYHEPLKGLVGGLSAAQKCELYESGIGPAGLKETQLAELRAALPAIRSEDADSWHYEGGRGPSPRLIRQVLLQAALSPDHECLSPFAVLDELDELCGRGREHPFLDREVEPGGYHDHRAFVGYVEARVLDRIEDDVRAASGLVEEGRYVELLERYVSEVHHLVKGEKIHDPNTGEDREPDERLMGEVEERIGVEEERGELRRSLISRIAAWAIDHPGRRVDIPAVFPEYLEKLRQAYFREHREHIQQLAAAGMNLLVGAADRVAEGERGAAEAMVQGLLQDRGYCRACAREGLARLVAARREDDRR